ncbi:MAG: acyl-CoA/acyl-ACP dehydrogenase [Planctomycetes bacterium]|nr:acyl-CoA/acyl-ACP dehydrogenase [Planctomycetota bacterium]
MAHVYGIDAAGEALLAGPVAKAKAVAAAHAEDVDGKGRFPDEGMRALAEQGLWGLCVEKAAGGLGAGPNLFAGVVEELATACASTAMVYVMHVTAGQMVAASKTVADRGALLAEMAAGRHLTTLAFSEKGSRSHFWAPVSALVEQGAGFSTSAQKSWVTSAAKADSYVSSAQAPRAASPLESALYLVRKGSRGVRIAGPWHGLGLRGNDSAPVSFEGLAVGKGDLLTEPGKGADGMLQVVLPWFAVGTSSMAHGLCRAAVAATAGHLGAAGFEHAGTKLRDLPTLRARLAQMSIRTEASRSLLGRTVASMAAPTAETPLLVLQARAAALEAALEVTDLGMRACGGAAFSRHLPLERVFRDARAGWIMAPTVDHLQEFVGRALVGLPLFG